jgi:hypothetical protein
MDYSEHKNHSENQKKHSKRLVEPALTPFTLHTQPKLRNKKKNTLKGYH